MELIDWLKVVFFISFVLGISLVYAGDSTTGIGVFFIAVFAVCGIILNLGIIKEKTSPEKKLQRIEKNAGKEIKKIEKEAKKIEKKAEKIVKAAEKEIKK
ncbi:MAG: hypothetical protein ABH850_02345 [Candidatus Micrarchaeota archaeon]